MRTNIFLNLNLLFLLLSFLLQSCSNNDTVVTPSPPYTPPPGYTVYQRGMIEAVFQPTIQKSDAEQFLQGLNLVLLNYSDLNDGTHLGLVTVPVGQEQKWADSLKTFSSFINRTSLVALIHIE